MAFDRPDLSYLLDDERREADRGPLGLADAERAVMAAVLMSPLAWTPVKVTDAYRADMVKLLKDSLRVPPAEAEAWGAGLLAAGHAASTIDGLITRDWLARWEYGGNDCVTLTPLSAIRIGVELIDPWDTGATQWALPADPRRRLPIKLRDKWQPKDEADGLDYFERIVDPAPGPLEELMMTEATDPDTGRPLLDPETGKPQKVPVTLWGEMVKLSKVKRTKGSKKSKGKKGKRKKVKAT